MSEEKKHNWDKYIDINRKLLLSLKKLESSIKKIVNEENIQRNEVYSIMTKMKNFLKTNNSSSELNNFEKIFKNLQIHSGLILNILNGGEDEEVGLIELTSIEINNVENFLKQNPVITPIIEEQISKSSIDFNSKRARLLASLNNEMGRENVETLSLVNYEELSIENVVSAIIKDFKIIEKLFEENGTDEDILMKVIAVTEVLELYKDTTLSKSLLKEKIKKSKSGNYKCYILNFLDIMNIPIKERLIEIKKIINLNNHTFLTLDENSKKIIFQYYEEILEKIFKCNDRKILDKIKERKNKSKIDDLEILKSFVEKYQNEINYGFEKFLKELASTSGLGSGGIPSKESISGIINHIENYIKTNLTPKETDIENLLKKIKLIPEIDKTIINNLETEFRNFEAIKEEAKTNFIEKLNNE